MNIPTEQDVLDWERQRREALLAGDAEALAPLLSEQLAYVHSTAACDGQASYLTKLSGGALRYRTLAFSELAVQTGPGVALVRGRMDATVVKDGQDKAVRSLFLTVWMPEDGAWRMRAHQGTPLPAEGTAR